MVADDDILDNGHGQHVWPLIHAGRVELLARGQFDMPGQEVLWRV
jgi:hypothetical protein